MIRTESVQNLIAAGAVIALIAHFIQNGNSVHTIEAAVMLMLMVALMALVISEMAAYEDHPK